MKLSPQIQAVCDMTLQGHKNERIAEALHVSVHTVKKYKVRLYRYLGVHTKHELRRKIIGQPERIEAPTRMAVYLAYRQQGLTYKEIGRLEGVTPDHVRTYVYRYGE